MKYDRQHVVRIVDEPPPNAGSEAQVVLALLMQLVSNENHPAVVHLPSKHLAFAGKLRPYATSGRS